MANCTIAIPVYNRERLVRQALDSALAQDAPELEILVVDNCSTDGTWEALQGYSDPRLRLARNERNVGLFGNFDRCLDLAQGRYLRFLCSDDRLTPGCLRREIEMMEARPNVVLLSTRAARVNARYERISEFANHLPPGVYPGAEMIGNVLWVLSHYCANPLNYPSGVLLKTEAARRAGQFGGSFGLVGDLDFWFRALEHGDAAIADHIGCEVLAHPEQEGQVLFDRGQYIEEWLALAERWHAALERRGFRRRVDEQIAACAVWAAWYCLRQKRREGARRNWRTARSRGISPVALCAATARFVAIQLLLRLANVRLQPPRPERSRETPALASKPADSET